MVHFLDLKDIETKLKSLSDEEKSAYLAMPAPDETAQFAKQTIGQRLFSEISDINDKWHTNAAGKTLEEFAADHNLARDNLLKSVVGADYFTTYQSELENLRKKRIREVMEKTEHLYCFSPTPPENLVVASNNTPNASSNKIHIPLHHAQAAQTSPYILQPPSNGNIEFHTDENIVVINGCEPKEFLQRQPLSYQYEVDKKSFTPEVNLDGQFHDKYSSAGSAEVVDLKGPFSITDMVASQKQSGWDTPVYFIPNKNDKATLQEKINQLRGLGASKRSAMEQVSEQYPNSLINLRRRQELLEYAKQLDLERKKEEQRREIEKARQIGKDLLLEIIRRRKANEEANKIMIKRGFQNRKNQKAAKKVANKKERETGKPLTEKDIKILKLKAASKKSGLSIG